MYYFKKGSMKKKKFVFLFLLIQPCKGIFPKLSKQGVAPTSINHYSEIVNYT